MRQPSWRPAVSPVFQTWHGTFWLECSQEWHRKIVVNLFQFQHVPVFMFFQHISPHIIIIIIIIIPIPIPYLSNNSSFSELRWINHSTPITCQGHRSTARKVGGPVKENNPRKIQQLWFILVYHSYNMLKLQLMGFINQLRTGGPTLDTWKSLPGQYKMYKEAATASGLSRQGCYLISFMLVANCLWSVLYAGLMREHLHRMLSRLINQIPQRSLCILCSIAG